MVNLFALNEIAATVLAALGLFGVCIVPIPLAYNGMSDGLLSGRLMSVGLSVMGRMVRG